MSFNYEMSELRKVEPANDCRIKITSDAGETRWMSVRPETFAAIRAALIAQSVQCDMTADCKTAVSHIDSAGFVYCAFHGEQRRRYEPCRKLRPHELRKVLRGEPVTKY
jgi:hypothetical protein